jgi:hypothetical protein
MRNTLAKPMSQGASRKMCMMVYLAADEPLDLVAWDEANPSFWVGGLDAVSNIADVSGQFTKPSIVYAGSHEQCGCGFLYGPSPAEEIAPGELPECRESNSALAQYVRAQLERVGQIELFSCWAGDEEVAPEHYRDISVEELSGRSFYLIERELLRIHK